MPPFAVFAKNILLVCKLKTKKEKINRLRIALIIGPVNLKGTIMTDPACPETNGVDAQPVTVRACNTLENKDHSERLQLASTKLSTHHCVCF
jgi:hypothetical protein